MRISLLAFHLVAVDSRSLIELLRHGITLRHRFAILPSRMRHTLLLIHNVIGALDLLSEVHHLLLLIGRGDMSVSVHHVVHCLGQNLRLLEVSLSGDVVRLLDRVHAHDFVIRLLFKFFTIVRNFEALSNNADLA